MHKLIRITTIPISIEKLLENQLQFMQSDFEVIAISSNKEELQRVGKLQGVSTFAVDMTRKITPLKDLKALWHLWRFFIKEKPFIVHTHTPKAGTLGMIAAKLAGVPHRLHTVAGLPLMEEVGIKRKLLNFVEKITYSCATNIYPNSDGLKSFIVKERFCKPDKLKIIGKGSSNGIDTDHFQRTESLVENAKSLRNSWKISSDTIVYCFVGRLVGDKGINELIEAYRNIKNSEKNTFLLLVGPREENLDSLRSDIIHYIENDETIIETGFVDDVRPYMAVADIFVFPSYREGFPNVVMQAGAMELTCIVTDINGCNEIIKNDINGLIIPAKSSILLRDAMFELLSDREKNKRLASCARPMIVERYGQSIVWNELLKEYQNLEDN